SGQTVPAREPDPTPAPQLPDPPYSLCALAHPWHPDREPPLWTLVPGSLRRALRMAGCGRTGVVLEYRPALLDRTRLAPWRPYRVLLSPAAVVISPEYRTSLNKSTLNQSTLDNMADVVVGDAGELAELPAQPGLRRVLRLPVRAAADPPPD